MEFNINSKEIQAFYGDAHRSRKNVSKYKSRTKTQNLNIFFTPIKQYL